MASQKQKDKRTKDQILRLLDDALVQEDRLSAEINTLSAQLDECRKRAEDPRSELQEEALPSSKVPFRLDFYRTTGNTSLKGIIEHLPSRQTRAFEGDGQEIMLEFVKRFLPIGSMNAPLARSAEAESSPEIAAQPESPALAPAVQPASPTPPVIKVPAPRMPPANVRTTQQPAEPGQEQQRPSKLLRRLQEEFLGEFPDLSPRAQPS